MLREDLIQNGSIWLEYCDCLISFVENDTEYSFH
jgi:hypothetical protein